MDDKALIQSQMEMIEVLGRGLYVALKASKIDEMFRYDSRLKAVIRFRTDHENRFVIPELLSLAEYQALAAAKGFEVTLEGEELKVRPLAGDHD